MVIEEQEKIGIETLTLRGKEIPYEIRKIKNIELSFWPDNPRIYDIVHAGYDEPSQDHIFEVLSHQDHVKKLVQSIEANGGIIEPVWVRDGDSIVFEGNSRLAAYRILAKKDALKWAKMKCRVLPRDVPDDDLIYLLDQYHIIPRKDWSPYVQAWTFWKRLDPPKVTASTIAVELGLSQQKVQRDIDIFAFMNKYDDHDSNHWSFFEQYIKSTKITKIRDRYQEEFDDVFVEKVYSGEIPKAKDVRDKLTLICGVGGKLIDEFINKNNNFESCYEKAQIKSDNEALYNSFLKFRTKIGDLYTKKELQNMDKARLNKCQYELKKIKSHIEKLLAI